ncbi:BON domain-containing protein [Caenimonas aquaedulcis]|uniref:BON domain-containing protein n=1 Tax=Caenimonas aquaedulcis TaxID=2793270 RepID=A0A931MJF1_9BURK|nr:BON domain-containing protein [Caenimonas aquaedulcis]MBG9390230.1 BON domain-containing protein [Caenimonas aquaedulcis]
MKTDMQLKDDVTAELAWTTGVDAAGIGVAVKDGIVTLSGTLATFAEKHLAEAAVRRVAGVRGVALDLEVQLAPGHKRNDSEVAQAAVNALNWSVLVPHERVKVQVENGWVTLSGEVDWGYQQVACEQCVRPLIGVRGVINDIVVKPHALPRDLRDQIAAALERHAEREAKHIQIEVDGGVVTLKGVVHSLRERDAAVGTVGAAKGVSRVVDRLEVVA